MTGLDELLAPSAYAVGVCHIPQALERIADEEDRAKVAAACDDPRVPVVNVLAALRQLIGVPPSAQSVRRHRSRVTRSSTSYCRCP